MKSNRLLLGSAVIILALANVFYWWPNNAEQQRTLAQPPLTGKVTVNLDTLRKLEFLPLQEGKVVRDLFNQVEDKRKAVVETAKPPVAKPLRTDVPELPEKVAVQDTLGRYFLAGVVKRDGVREAYLLDGGTPLIVHAGEALSQSVKVESIGERTAVLRDTQSGLTKKLVLKGEQGGN